MKKILAFLFLLPAVVFGWVGSSNFARLAYPASYYYETELSWDLRSEPKSWQVFIVPRGIYGWVSNPDQGIDKHQITLKDVTNGDTWLLHEEQDHNSVSYSLLSPGTLIKKSFFNGQHSYEIELKAWDLNGDTYTDTARFVPRSKSNPYTSAGTDNPVVESISSGGGGSGGTPFVDDANTLALYHLDEGTGTSAGDETGNYDATVANNWTTGKFSDGLQCETTVANFTQGTLLDVVPSAFTVEMWFKLDSASYNSEMICHKKNTATDDYLSSTLVTDGTLRFATRQNGAALTSIYSTTNSFTVGSWYYLVLVWDTVRGKEIWVNGVRENNDVGETTLMINGTSTDFFLAYFAGQNYGFDGVVDEIRVSDIARTETEIEAHWNANKP